jgi:stalled ribosome rescue protein Dom34
MLSVNVNIPEEVDETLESSVIVCEMDMQHIVIEHQQSDGCGSHHSFHLEQERSLKSTVKEWNLDSCTRTQKPRVIIQEWIALLVYFRYKSC